LPYRKAYEAGNRYNDPSFCGFGENIHSLHYSCLIFSGWKTPFLAGIMSAGQEIVPDQTFGFIT